MITVKKRILINFTKEELRQLTELVESYEESPNKIMQRALTHFYYAYYKHNEER